MIDQQGRGDRASINERVGDYLLAIAIGLGFAALLASFFDILTF